MHGTCTFYSEEIPFISADHLRSVINRCGGGSREHALSGLSAFISFIIQKKKRKWKSVVVELDWDSFRESWLRTGMRRSPRANEYVDLPPASKPRFVCCRCLPRKECGNRSLWTIHIENSVFIKIYLPDPGRNIRLWLAPIIFVFEPQGISSHETCSF